jgi:hypothetical protein
MTFFCRFYQWDFFLQFSGYAYGVKLQHNDDVKMHSSLLVIPSSQWRLPSLSLMDGLSLRIEI